METFDPSHELLTCMPNRVTSVRWLFATPVLTPDILIMNLLWQESIEPDRLGTLALSCIIATKSAVKRVPRGIDRRRVAREGRTYVRTYIHTPVCVSRVSHESPNWLMNELHVKYFTHLLGRLSRPPSPEAPPLATWFAYASSPPCTLLLFLFLLYHLLFNDRPSSE